MRFFSSRLRQSGVSRAVTALAALAILSTPITVGRVAAATDSDRTARAVNGDLKGSYRFERNGWIYVHLEGGPARVGPPSKWT